MTFSKLQTVMYEAAQIVNQRPIGTHSDSPEDFMHLWVLSLRGLVENIDPTTHKVLLEDFGRSGHGKFS